MTLRHITVNEHTCDGCGKSYMAPPDEEQPPGFYLTAAHIHGAGGDSADDIFACTERCIKSAVTNALNERGRG